MDFHTNPGYTDPYGRTHFRPVYDRINEMYPPALPLSQRQVDQSFPGLEALESIIVQRIHDHDNFQTEWVAFEKMVEGATGKEVIGTTYGQAPSFSSFLELERTTTGDLTRVKELFFAVSLVGPFYIIVGRDESVIQVDSSLVRITNFLRPAPEGEYAEAFNKIQELIQQRFTGYRFIPYRLAVQSLEGLALRYTDVKEVSIFHALFNAQVDLMARVVGNDMYGLNDWISPEELASKGGWVAYPPMEGGTEGGNGEGNEQGR